MLPNHRTTVSHISINHRRLEEAILLKFERKPEPSNRAYVIPSWVSSSYDTPNHGGGKLHLVMYVAGSSS